MGVFGGVVCGGVGWFVGVCGVVLGCVGVCGVVWGCVGVYGLSESGKTKSGKGKRGGIKEKLEVK